MRLRVEHTTTFTYDAPIVEASTELRLRPRDVEGQRCASFRLRTEPRGVRIHEFVDRLGNVVGHFDVLEPHQRLVVTATSEVETSRFEHAAPPTPLELHDYLAPSEYAVVDDAVAAFASTHAGTGGAAERARRLMAALGDTLAYERGATSVQTPAPEVLALGRGVCQDFAHALIAACRHEGIPARYVSGYLHDDALADEHGASHAWVDVFDAEQGWLSLDPTHDREQDEEYVRVAVGRDYADVPPTRGVFKGAAEETLAVEVSVSVV
jgi:transglutaminase-like putative cysteine protease